MPKPKTKTKIYEPVTRLTVDTMPVDVQRFRGVWISRATDWITRCKENKYTYTPPVFYDGDETRKPLWPSVYEKCKASGCDPNELIDTLWDNWLFADRMPLLNDVVSVKNIMACNSISDTARRSVGVQFRTDTVNFISCLRSNTYSYPDHAVAIDTTILDTYSGISCLYRYLMAYAYGREAILTPSIIYEARRQFRRAANEYRSSTQWAKLLSSELEEQLLRGY